MKYKSLRDLEKENWVDLDEYPSDLVRRCYQYTKIPISELSIEQLRTLVSQEIGLNHLIKPVLQELEKNILAEGDLYEGDLLSAISSIKIDVWKNHPLELQRLKSMIDRNMDVLESKLGAKKLASILEKTNLAGV